jgi:hypothetical protein
VLIENPGASDSINHLGVEVESVDDVRSEHERVTAAGLPVWVEGETTCCYSVQDKFWVEGGTHKFEVYTVLADADVMKSAATSDAASIAAPTAANPTEICCAPHE